MIQMWKTQRMNQFYGEKYQMTRQNTGFKSATAASKEFIFILIIFLNSSNEVIWR